MYFNSYVYVLLLGMFCVFCFIVLSCVLFVCKYTTVTGCQPNCR